MAPALAVDTKATCRALAFDLGEDAATANSEAPTGLMDAVTYWCGLATNRLRSLPGTMVSSVQDPSCILDVAAQASCEQTCATDTECPASGTRARCTPGALLGKWAGECTGTCFGSADLSGLAAICTVRAVNAAVDALAYVTIVRASSASVVEAVSSWQAR